MGPQVPPRQSGLAEVLGGNLQPLIPLVLEVGACHWDARPPADPEACAPAAPSSEQRPPGVGMAPSPPAATRKPCHLLQFQSSLEPLERPLGALMTATEGPFMQERSRGGGSLRAKPRSLASRPKCGAA